ncbi:MAG: Ig domain-containing protein [Candidatus Korobacteraceae bacterium]
MRIPLAASVVLLWLANLVAFGQTLQITGIPPQGAIVGQSYTLPLAATGGSPPYTWHVTAGDLPPGLKLHRHLGNISGVPTTPGDYHFTVTVVDSGSPKMQIQRDIIIQVIAGLAIDWKEPPAVHGPALSGSAIATNETAHDFDVTVVIVAVNKIGRATTLGYQHFMLSAHSTSPVIPFGSSPGPETYYVRADAVAHRLGHQHIYRSSKQTSELLKVTQF